MRTIGWDLAAGPRTVTPGGSKAVLPALAMAAVCLMLVEAGQADVAVWNRWEQTLTSSRTYSNPYQQVTLSVTYAGPNGQKIKGYGFWDGGNTFKIRCMFSTPGTWTWTTTCNHTDDTGLHNRTGDDCGNAVLGRQRAVFQRVSEDQPQQAVLDLCRRRSVPVVGRHGLVGDQHHDRRRLANCTSISAEARSSTSPK